MKVIGPDGYIEPGDEIELFDEHGLSIGIVFTVEDIDKIDVPVTFKTWVKDMRVTDPSGMPSGFFGLGSHRVDGDELTYIHIQPGLRLPGRRDEP